ncbi:signal peptide peptidase SppA [Nitratiruptor sp. YY09-18]|uniref:signal peptide peptidase SppA n=1 Tax=Nitratiruptor sp. YY09-18 TaxID=2724901 RepID=UPI001916C0C9|nr:signal peptide peptidase SppA [Nitratiruptor sp. YY09-18]BCD67585.1 protease IV [Nitratiruptor sp. YY09-18]
MENDQQNKRGGITEFFRTLFLPLTATLDFLQKYFKAIILLLIILAIIGASQKESLQKPNLMRITLYGTIIDSKPVLDEIKLAQKPSIKGVLFVVDSPGGAVAPSIEISEAIKRLAQKKPVVAYAAGTMASGSYYASIWSKKIVANPGAIIGSIGVIFESPQIKGLLDKIGIKPQVVKAGKYKEVGTPFREWKEYEKQEIEKIIFDTYNMFTSDVAKARGLDLNRSDDWAQAHIFTARQAKKVGLVDEVGTIEEAKKLTAKLAKVKNPRWYKKDKIDQIIEKLANETSSKLSMLLAPKLL